jgi:serine protease AprX
MSRLRRALPALALLAVASCTLSPTPSASSKLDRALRDWARHPTTASVRVLVQARPGVGARVLDHLRQAIAGSVTPSTAPDLLVAELSTAALRNTASDADVAHISFDAPVRSLATSSLSQNVLLATEALLPRQYSGSRINVAVVDSGVRPSADINVAASHDFTSGTAVNHGPKDPYGHGTHVSGLIGSTGATSNGQYQGIAPGSRLIVLRVLDDQGRGYTSNVIAAIDFAVANRKAFGIDIINLSLGHPVYESAADDPLVQAVERAVAAGIVVVTSAGNFGGDPDTHVTGYGGITSPGNAPDAITVGALETYQTAARADDVVAWYSSRGPTWYDGFQKPDIVAPGSHMVSDVPTSSTIATSYPGGLIVTTGTCNLTKLSGTSMAAGVVTGVVSLMLQASRSNHPGARLTPGAVKAIFQYTAFPMADYDTLTQGAGALNAAGAVALAAAIDPNEPVGAWWLTTGVNTWTTVAGETIAWGQRVVWGDHVIWGDSICTNDPAWALRVVWGDRVIWADRVIWGDSTVWDGNQPIWGNRVVWGDSLIGRSDGTSVTWGSLSSDVTANRVVWGDVSRLNIAPTSTSWGNLERANGDLIEK